MEKKELRLLANAAMESYPTRKDKHANPCAAYRQGFMEGIDIYTKQIWHDAKKTPTPMKDCLFYLNDPMRIGWHLGRIENQGANKGKWNVYGYFTPALHENIISWAYLDDLIPIK